MALGRWEAILLETCKSLGFLPPKLLKTISFSQSPEKLLQSQLTEEHLNAVIREAAKALPGKVGAAITKQDHNLGRFVLIDMDLPRPGARVYEGWDKILGRDLTVYFVPEEGPADWEVLRREVNPAMGLRHEMLQQIIAVDRVVGGLAIGVERVVGAPISGRNMAMGFMLPIVRDAAHAIHAANEAEVLHLDLKPDNILITDLVDVKIVGLGMARILSPGAGSGGRSRLLGTPGYMSPEQARGRVDAFDARTDVYGLGATLYKLLTERRPFPGDDPAKVLKETLAHSPEPVRRLAPRVPKEIESITMKCLQADPRQRYTTCGEVADELGRHLEQRPIEATSISLKIRTGKKRKATRAVLLGLALIALALSYAISLATDAYFTSNRDETERLVRQVHAQFFDGEIPAARKSAEQILAGNPDHIQAKYWLLRIRLHEEIRGRPIPHPVAVDGILGWDTILPPPPRSSLLSAVAALRPRLSPEDQQILTALELVLAGNLANATAPLESALKRAPWDSEVKLHLGLAMLRSNRFEECRKLLDPPPTVMVADQCRAAIALSRLGAALEKNFTADPGALKEIDLGIGAVGKVDNPLVAAAVISLLNAKATILSSLGRGEAARSELLEALRKSSKFEKDARTRMLRGESRSRLAVEFAAAGKANDALALFKTAQADFASAARGLPEEPGVLIRWAEASGARAEILLSRADSAGARAALQTALQKVGASMKRRKRLDGALLEIRLTRDAQLTGAISRDQITQAFSSEVAALDDLLEKVPGLLPALIRRGHARMLWALNDPTGVSAEVIASQALKDYADAVKSFPKNPQVLSGQAEARIARGRVLLPLKPEQGFTELIKALTQLNELVFAHPGLVRARVARAEVFGELGRAAQMLKQDPAASVNFLHADIDTCLEGDGGRVQPRLVRARVLIDLSGIKPDPKWLLAATRDCSEILRNDPKRIEALRIRGTAYLLRGRIDLKATEAAPSLNQALADLTGALKLRPDDPRLLRLRGTCHLEMGRLAALFGESNSAAFSAARADLERVVKLDPSLREEVAPLLDQTRSAD